jgi:CRISPR system Cascade subunit CasC
MLIEVHMIQNHSPGNLNRDDLGAPKTCYFGGVLRSRISSQCIKRSIRMSDDFKELREGLRTRELAKLVAERSGRKQKDVEDILKKCGLKSKKEKKSTEAEGDSTSDSNNESDDPTTSKMLVYTTQKAVDEMAEVVKNVTDVIAAAEQFAKIIETYTIAPDMALQGRMLEAGEGALKGKKTTVEAALQMAHAISTHEARPEVDYFVAADDVPGLDHGAGYVDEAMFASACFYKYFSINWEKLKGNLLGNAELAAKTVAAYLYGAATILPSGKQNSFAAHNPPSGILIELRLRNQPVSYANAFAKPVAGGDLIGDSIGRLAQYASEIETCYGPPAMRLWYSPHEGYKMFITQNNVATLRQLIDTVISQIA